MDARLIFGGKTVVAVIAVLIAPVTSAVAGTGYSASSFEVCGAGCGAPDKPGDTGKVSTRFVPNKAGPRLAFLADSDAPVPAHTQLDDEACLRSGCHDKNKLQDKEIKFGKKKVVFRHRVHFEKPIEGLAVHCSSCHFKQSRKKHFEVTKETCFLCHFKTAKPDDTKNSDVKVRLNEGRSKCGLCHTIPTKSLQRQLSTDDPDKKPITHQTIEKAKVPCQGCHFRLVKGGGEVTQEGCLDCHDQGLAKRGDKKLMHEKHVAIQRATCFDCHQTIRHMAKGNSLDLDGVRTSCALCHEDQHRYQKLLLLGEAREGVSATPGLMNAVNTNCTGCHTEKTHKNGQTLMKGTSEACVGCHGEGQRKMLGDWKDQIRREIKGAKEVEEEAVSALEAAEGAASEDKLEEARAMIEKGRQILSIVEIGNGVHNKKYSIKLLDAALVNFEDTIDMLEGGN